MTCFLSTPSPAYQICSLPHGRSGSHGNETTFICCFAGPLCTTFFLACPKHTQWGNSGEFIRIVKINSLGARGMSAQASALRCISLIASWSLNKQTNAINVSHVS